MLHSQVRFFTGRFSSRPCNYLLHIFIGRQHTVFVEMNIKMLMISSRRVLSAGSSVVRTRFPWISLGFSAMQKGRL